MLVVTCGEARLAWQVADALEKAFKRYTLQGFLRRSRGSKMPWAKKVCEECSSQKGVVFLKDKFFFTFLTFSLLVERLLGVLCSKWGFLFLAAPLWLNGAFLTHVS